MPHNEEWKENLELLSGFIVEAKEHTENIDKKFLELEDDPSNEGLINDIFRSIHTVKGGAGMLNLVNMGRLAHKIETLLNFFRDQKKVTDVTAIEILLQGCDLLNKLLCIVEGKIADDNFDLDPADPAIDAMIEKVGAVDDACRGVISTPVEAKVPSPLLQNSKKILVSSGKSLVDHIQLSIDQINIFPMDKVTLDLVKFATALDLAVPGENEEHVLEIQSSFLKAKDLEHGEERSVILESAKFLIKRITSPFEEKEEFKDAGAAKSKSPDNESKTIRIEQKLIDHLMNLVGEVIVARNSFEQILRNAQKDPQVPEAFFKDLRDSTKNFVRISEEMQNNVMQMRMIPVKSLFQKFPRLIRDISKKSGKKIELELIGEHTDIDKAIAEDVADPLLHMIRNSIDHGIELPEDRLKAGKAEAGKIIMRALHEGNYIIIEVKDDGRGIDKERILRKAIENNLTTKEASVSLTDEEILAFIFAPGFSTAEKITDISGRGVGMDVVNSNIKKLNGKIKVSTELGKGTVIRLELPLTMAVMDSLLVKVGAGIYALPLEAVIETIKIPSAQLRNIAYKQIYSLRGEVIGVEWLHRLMNVETLNHTDRITMLVLKIGNEKCGLVVDSIFRQEEIVVKALPEYLSGPSVVSGASILGDGKAILILDIAKVMASAVVRNPAHHQQLAG